MTTSPISNLDNAEAAPLPQASRRTEDVAGHWLLARLGKRVLRPGGAKMTIRMLADAALPGADVVELAPGLGRTAREILEHGPRSYQGVDQDPDAVRRVSALVGERGQCHVANASETGLPTASADVVVGEAMLTMQTDRGKRAIVDEAHRLLRPGGRYAIHELALRPDDLDPAIATDIRRALARSIKVNARPLTIAEWRDLLTQSGFEVEAVRTAPMDLLRIRRNVADEGIGRAAKILFNVVRNPDARKRVMGMRSTFNRHHDSLTAVSIVARIPRDSASVHSPTSDAAASDASTSSVSDTQE